MVLDRYLLFSDRVISCAWLANTKKNIDFIISIRLSNLSRCLHKAERRITKYIAFFCLSYTIMSSAELFTKCLADNEERVSVLFGTKAR